MEVYLKVIEQLEVSNKHDCKYVQLEHLKGDRMMKLSVSENGKYHEFILVKTTQNFDTCFDHQYAGLINVVLPIFSIYCNGACYAVFKQEVEYEFQNHFNLDHMVLVLKSLAVFHGYVLSKPLATNGKDLNLKFCECLENHVQEIQANLTQGNVNMDLKLFKLQFDEVITKLKTSLNIYHWVPSLGSFNINPVYFKNNHSGQPLDFKILLSNSCQLVPPLYDMLVLIFTCTNKDTRKEDLQKLLPFYDNLLEKTTGGKILDLEQFNFQIRSFIPLMKLFNYNRDKELEFRSCNNGLQELVEFLHCPNLLREECYEILLNYLGDNNYSLQNFFLTELQQRSGNLGDYFKLKMEINREHRENIVNLFVKFLPSNNESTNAIVKSGPSKKEDFFYNFFVKEFERCGLNQFLDFAPKCFLSKLNYVLVLEDLDLQGYRLSSNQNNFTHGMLKLTVKKLAQLHACSLVFEEAKSKELQKNFRLDEHYQEYLEEILFQTKVENELKLLADVGEKCVTDYLIYLYPEIAKSMTMEEFHQRSKLTFKSYYTKLLKSDRYKNTLCHGDTWATNIMFKFDSKHSPVDCKLVDFQLTRYCPPAQDVLSFFYLTTSKDIRTKHLSALLDEYYRELSKIVTSFGFDMDKVLPAGEFQKSCHYMKSQAVCQALFYAPINLTQAEDRLVIFSDPENFEKIMRNDRRPFIEAMMQKYPFYKDRIGELVQDLYDVCENKQY